MKQSLSKSDKRFLAVASDVASTSQCRMKHGAVVVFHGRILASSTNANRNDPKFINWNHCSYHAEERSLKRAGYPKGVTIYVSRVNRQGEIRCSMPCRRCQRLIDELGCRVVWSSG